MGPFRFPGRWAHAAVMPGLAGLAGAVLWWRWVGYQGHDDAYYAWAAMDWAEHAPVLGQTHWALRYPLVLAAVDLGAYTAFLLMGYAADGVPRYFMVTAAMAAVPVAVAGATLLRARPRAAGWIAAGFAASCLGLLYLENTEPMFAEQRAAAFIAEQPGTVYMDAETGWRTRALLIRPRLLDRVASGPPPPGALVAGEDGAVDACLRAPACPQRASAPAFRPGPGWTEVARYDPPRRRLGAWLRGIGAAQWVPPDILRKIEQPGRALVVYRTPAS